MDQPHRAVDRDFRAEQEQLLARSPEGGGGDLLAAIGTVAPERFTGCKLIDLQTPDGKLRPEQIEPLLARLLRSDLM